MTAGSSIQPLDANATRRIARKFLTPERNKKKYSIPKSDLDWKNSNAVLTYREV
jgi:hypothetical protein